jgi:hypothetical protein
VFLEHGNVLARVRRYGKYRRRCRFLTVRFYRIGQNAAAANKLEKAKKGSAAGLNGWNYWSVKLHGQRTDTHMELLWKNANDGSKL